MTRARSHRLAPSGTDRRAGVERVVVWFVALAVVAAIVGSVVYLADDIRRETPDSEFSVSLDGETGTLTVEHAGDDPVRDRATTWLRVVVVDGETNASATIQWAGDDTPVSRRGTGFPVNSGDSVQIDDVTADSDGDGSVNDAAATVGFPLSPGDQVGVRWRGAKRSGAQRTVTLTNATLG